MLYAPATPRQEAPERTAQPASQTPPSAQPSAAPPPSDVQSPLTTEEQAMIDRYFPSSPTMALRIYGPGQHQQTLNPTALGNRLDLRA